MRRRLLNLLTILSLLLCAAAAGAGVASLYLPPFGQMWGTSWDGNGSGHILRGWVAYGGLRDSQRGRGNGQSCGLRSSR